MRPVARAGCGRTPVLGSGSCWNLDPSAGISGRGGHDAESTREKAGSEGGEEDRLRLAKRVIGCYFAGLTIILPVLLLSSSASFGTTIASTLAV